MNTPMFLRHICLVWVVVALFCGVDQARAAVGPTPGVNYNVPNFAYSPAPTVTPGTCSVTTTTACVTNANCPTSETCKGVLFTGGMRKFVDSLPGLGASNNLGQQIPIAVKDSSKYPGSDYYEIALVEYREQMHSNLPPVTGTWPNQTGGTKLRGYVQEVNGVAVGVPHYLGPLILASKNRPVRIKFTNRLPIGAAGNLFLPVDTTIMGAGTGPNGGTEMYTQNRATLHLHGGIPGWVSDGTAHQWITPAGESTSYPKGASQQNVPDMPLPPNGSATFHWTNQQGGRLMFYHDHAYGTTGPDVYAGEAAGYLLVDPAEETALAAAGVPGTTSDLSHLIPLIIQDKTFVSNTTTTTDPLWDVTNWGGLGSLWFPHVYMPNQDPFTAGANGANPLGRWDYGPWFWPIFQAGIPPILSHVPEAFMDTPVVNGTAYPYVNVNPTQYRLRILNAANDRMLNLQLYVADPANGGVPVGAGGLTEVKMVPAELTTICTAQNVPNVPVGCFPATWAAGTPGMIPDILDSRPSGVPDPALRGPAMIQIGTEGGILPEPALLLNTPVGFEQNKRNIVVLNVLEKTLFMAPAERADVIVDFSKFAGKTIILYNDAPAPVPASDPRYDFYTGNPDFSATAGANNQGGAPSTLPGYGPNTRTIMQFRVAAGPNSTAPVDDYNPATLTTLQTALAAAYALAQDRPVVGESAYNQAFGTAFPDQVASIYMGSSLQPTWTFIDGTGATVTAAVPDSTTGTLPPGATIPIFNKAIQELFDPLGRMNATLGVELPFTNSGNQTTVPLGFIDPTTETIPDGQTQIWKITHNGVDTHGVHFHLVNVQVINRVGWDGMVRPTDPNELGWKDTVRMNPLEDIIVAMRAKKPLLPFGLPNNIRPLDVTMPVGSTFASFDPITGSPITVTNNLTNFGWEYTWHCHILGHEENDMMRPFVMAVATTLPAAPVLSIPAGGPPFVLNWTDGTPFNYATGLPTSTLGNPANEIGFRIERATGTGVFGPLPPTAPSPTISPANTTTYTDSTAVGNLYKYRIVAFNASGESASNTVSVGLSSLAPTNLVALMLSANQVQLNWIDNSSGGTGYQVERCTTGTCSVNGSWTTVATLGPNTVTTTLTATLTAGTNYRYRVRALNGGTLRPLSNVASVNLGVVPAAPSGLTAVSPIAHTVALSWKDNSNNNSSFTIQARIRVGVILGIPIWGPWTDVSTTVGANATTFNQNGLTPGQVRQYRIRSNNAFGSSGYFPATGGVQVTVL